jgi:sugar lactone lactonase YvrE
VSTGIITTIAGTGTGSYSGDNGAATSASLFFPKAIVFDTSGNYYIADDVNCRIRKVTASTGIMTTIAGTGSCSSSGDGGAATSAALTYPYGVAVDLSANVYIGDTSGHRVRKVTVSTGIITTIAGTGSNGYTGDGTATSVKLSYPWGLATDAAGNVYFGDPGNNRVRKITVSSGVLITIAGTGTGSYSGDGDTATSATLSSPKGVAFDASGNLYIADSGNNCIRKLTYGGTSGPTYAPRYALLFLH